MPLADNMIYLWYTFMLARKKKCCKKIKNKWKERNKKEVKYEKYTLYCVKKCFMLFLFLLLLATHLWVLFLRNTLSTIISWKKETNLHPPFKARCCDIIRTYAHIQQNYNLSSAWNLIKICDNGKFIHNVRLVIVISLVFPQFYFFFFFFI